NIETQQFWPKLTQIICQTQTSWSLAGDTNATVNAEERSMGGGDARTQFIKFLNDVNGQDLWSLQPERNRMQHWTSRSRSNELSGGSIIDRVVVKAGSMVDGQISIHEGKDSFIPFTDHRAITARMIITSTGNANSFFLPHRIAMNKPRIKYPTIQEKHRHQEFQNLFDEMARAKHLQDILVKDDESFMQLYNKTSKILLSSAETSYGRVPQYRSTARGNRVTNPEIQSQIGYLRSIGGAIRIIQNPDLYYLVSAKSRITYEKFRRKSQQQRINLLKYAKQERSKIGKTLFKMKAKAITQQAAQRSKGQVMAVLNGTSSKRVLSKPQFIPMPLIIKSTDSENLICEPEQVKEATRQYWSDLYHHDPPPNIPKPWLTTPSLIAVKNRVQQDPFTWPQLITIQDLRALLSKGNSRPAPGPDEWEKWVVKSLSDEGLELVRRMINYIVANSRFPGNTRDVWLSMFHKRGMRTDLLNWRGIILSNFIANVPMTWLNSRLIPYISEKK
ncbi:MAG: hypothetical protein NXY57DRAFT_1044854, partial [Lentinula lateritia]